MKNRNLHPHPWHDFDNVPPDFEKKRGQIESMAKDLAAGDHNARHLCRLALEDGPWHMNECNTAIMSALREVIHTLQRQTGKKIQPYNGPVVEIDLHLPPHLSGRRGRSYAKIPLPVRFLKELFRTEESFNYAIEVFSEGPHHESANNALFLLLLEALYDIINNNVEKENGDGVKA